MNKRLTLLLLFLLATFSFAACEKDDAPFFDYKTPDLTSVSNLGDSYALEINSSGDWYISSSDIWCWPAVSRGSGNATVQLNVEGNIIPSSRTATVKIISNGISKEVKVTQKASDGSEFHYKLPVVFHIIYNDPNNNKQNITKGHMATLLSRVNNLYKNSGVSMNLEFTLATLDPSGKTIEEPGVERVQWSGTYPLSAMDVMGNGTKYKSLLWDPNRYINILVYAFSSNEKNVLGIGHMPLTPKSYYLEGTTTSPVSYMTLDNLGYAHCVSINSNYVYELSSDRQYNVNDASVTIAHELGHHLGLYHAFTQDPEKGTVDDCYDTDYCQDTPSYNRVRYEAWLNNYLDNNPASDLSVMIKRTACDGTEFQARNIMDYYMCLGDRFSADQKSRVRHILTYGMLLPGPKILDTKLGTKSVQLDLPVRYLE